MKSFRKNNLLKKLTLKKSTITSLNKDDYNTIRGGNVTILTLAPAPPAPPAPPHNTIADRPHQNTC
ncbi:MAG: hypothetical protein GY757_57435 [bacterium]|nr:hypothetical protein [bacterium]